MKRLLESEDFAAIFYQSTYRTLDIGTYCKLHKIDEAIPLQYFLAMAIQKGLHNEIN